MAKLISIHAPREGSDPHDEGFCNFHPKFLSTLPARGATCTPPRTQKDPAAFLSTLPARGATYRRRRERPAGGRISIHAPREGSDTTL